MKKIPSGGWHGPQFRYGFHYDLHAQKNDTDLGAQCDVKTLMAALKETGADFIQTDTRGHAGYTSYPSKVKHAFVPAGLKKDALKVWREATRRLGLPLHCHYTGTYDDAMAQAHPDWAFVNPDGQPNPHGLCCRGPYVDEFLIPQMIELIDDYQVDGFWVDGDYWGVWPCYCHRCLTVWKEMTGRSDGPKDMKDPDWVRWQNMHRAGFFEYCRKYTRAVHQHKPGVLVCSNWLFTMRTPGNLPAETDWVSGDLIPQAFGQDRVRVETRFASTRGKHFDFMMWNFYGSIYQEVHGNAQPSAPTLKPAPMMMQEAASMLAQGGGVQIYNPAPYRDGRMASWSLRRMGEVARFVKARRTLCTGTESDSEVAVLHSECHLYAQPSQSLFWDVDYAAVNGAVLGLLEKQFSVDVLDEWKLIPSLDQYRLVVVAEQHDLSADMVEALKKYVQNGGGLLISGARMLDRFGPDFLGVKAGKVQEKATFSVTGGDGAVNVFSNEWRLPVLKSARELKSLLKNYDLKSPNCGIAATLHRVGKGRVVYAPFCVFRYYEHNHYPLLREFIGDLADAAMGKRLLNVTSPSAIDVVARRRGSNRKIIHFINRLSGAAPSCHEGGVDEIPPIGPVTLSLPLKSKPRSVKIAFEKTPLTWKWSRSSGGLLKVRIEQVHIHAALVINMTKI